MKVLIWIICMGTNALFYGIIHEFLAFIMLPSQDSSVAVLYGLLNGIAAGGCFGFCWWLAKRLCKKFDWNRITKEATEQGMTVSEYGKHGLPESFLIKLEELCNTVPYEQVKAQLKACVKKGKLTKDQYIILLEEYSKTK